MSSLLFGAPSALAHPHQFIDMEAQLVLDASGRLASVWTRWTWDESFSLSLAAGIGVNPDGPLTPEEEKLVDPEFAVNFASDRWLTYLSYEGRAPQIGPPRDKRYQLRDGVFIVEWELPLARPLALDKAPLRLQFYDPSFLALVTLTDQPTLRGPGAKNCVVRHERFVADEAAKKELALLLLLPIDATPDDPTVGRRFADHVEVRCGNGASEG